MLATVLTPLRSLQHWCHLCQGAEPLCCSLAAPGSLGQNSDSINWPNVTNPVDPENVLVGTEDALGIVAIA
jgi:hypothetical protein